MLPEPYYEADGITIYNADCREVLPYLPKVDLVLTDPPYGIGIDGQKESIQKGVSIRKEYEFAGWDKTTPPSELLRLAFGMGTHLVVCGANYFNDSLPAGCKGWVIWDKGQRGLTMSDCEIIFTNWSCPTRIYTAHRSRLWRENPQHPTQKPSELIKYLVQNCPGEPQTILDPFMGSGTTLVAAKQLGRKAIGIELEEKYCVIAVERLRQGCFNF
jgi:DNA modification methylase